MVQAGIETIKGVIMAVRETEGPTKSRRAMQAVPRAGGPKIRQLTFNWKAQDKYNELNNFKI